MILFAFIILLLMIVSFISIFVGLISPKAITWLFRKNLGRGKTSLIFTGITIGLAIVFSVIAGSNPKTFVESPMENKKKMTFSTKLVNKSQKALPTTKSTPTMLVTPTPTPADWVSNPQCPISVSGGVDACLRDKYPLQAKVRADTVALYITNTQNVEWIECEVTFDDNSYATNPDNFFTIEAGSITRVPWGNLIDGNGNRFDAFKTQPGVVDISCNVNHEQRESQYGGFQ